MGHTLSSFVILWQNCPICKTHLIRIFPDKWGIGSVYSYDCIISKKITIQCLFHLILLCLFSPFSLCNQKPNVLSDKSASQKFDNFVHHIPRRQLIKFASRQRYYRGNDVTRAISAVQDYTQCTLGCIVHHSGHRWTIFLFVCFEMFFGLILIWDFAVSLVVVKNVNFLFIHLCPFLQFCLV